MLGLIQVFVLVENEREARGVIPVGVLDGSGGVQLSPGTLDQHGAVSRRDGHAADAGIQEDVLAV